MYRRVLLCYDGSRESRDALRQGGELVAALRCETHIVAISNVSSVAAAYAAMVPGLFDPQSDCDTILKEALEWLRQRGVQAIPHTQIGLPIDVIPRLARELEVDLIVLGYVPRSGLARWWSGPGNASLLDRAHCSVLVAFG